LAAVRSSHLNRRFSSTCIKNHWFFYIVLRVVFMRLGLVIPAVDIIETKLTVFILIDCTGNRITLMTPLQLPTSAESSAA